MAEKKECLVGFNSREAGTGVGFVLHQRALGSGKWLLTVCWLLTVPPKGRGNSTQDPFAYTSIPQFGLKPRAKPTNIILRESTVKITALRINKAMHTWPIFDRFPELPDNFSKTVENPFKVLIRP